MKRREFVKKLGIATVGTPILLNNLKVQAMGGSLFNIPKSAEDRVLIIIRLNGGNDGLNTVIPLDQYANLTLQRNNVIIPQGQILSVTNDIGFHPVMTGMQTMFNDGKLGIVQNVGYPDQNRSHFRSMDIWTSGLIDNPATTGWLGRQLDTEHSGYPAGYPNTTHPDPFAISMGYELSATCQGQEGNYSHSVVNPFDSYNLTSSNSLNDGTYYGSHIEHLSILIDQANAYGSQINTAANAGNSLSTLYDANNDLAMQLQNVAKMISGGLQTKIYILNVNGFDTHSDQVSATDVTQGTHADLMKTVSDAVHAFQDDLSLLGLEDRVIGMSFSEFGRQIASNASLGTDHGDAAPMFFFGTCLETSVFGPNPTIDSTIVNQAGLPMQIDFRDVYASVLKDWFQVDTTTIEGLFEHTVTYYSLVGGCAVGIEENRLDKANLYPNPCKDNTTLKITTQNESVRISLMDITGRMVKTYMERSLSPGSHEIQLDVREFSRGQYFVLVEKESGDVKSKLIVM